MNNPQSAASGDTAVDQATLNVFNTVFPGYNQKIQNGTTNADMSSYTGLAVHIKYSCSASQQFATQAGLLPNTITQNDIGNLWAGNVSSNEVSQRVTDAVVATSSAPAPVQQYLAAPATTWMTPGHAPGLYYLNPHEHTPADHAEPQCWDGRRGCRRLVFDTRISRRTAQASALGAFLANWTFRIGQWRSDRDSELGWF